jgi:hypothetical protein
MGNSFFPLNKDLIENPEFKKLPVISRLYYLLLISDFNQCGEFFRSDSANAVKLKVSVDTIRRARRLFTKLGWIEARPGFRSSSGKPVATVYKAVKYANVEDGKFFAPMQRYAFERLIHMRMSGAKRAVDEKAILIFCYFTYLQTKFGNSFFVTKRDFAGLTGFTEIGETLKQLAAPFFVNGDPLIKLTDGYHKMTIETIGIFEENGDNRLHDLEELKRQKDKVKNQKEYEGTIQLFEELYKKRYGRFPGLMQEQKLELTGFVKRYGPQKMQRAIKSFFAAEEIPYFSKDQSRTAKVFMKCYKEFM